MRFRLNQCMTGEMKQMRTDIIKLTAAALYGDITQEFEGMKLDEDFFEAVRFLDAMSAKIRCNEDGVVFAEPVTALPRPGSILTFGKFMKENALFFLGAAANLGFTVRFPDIRDEQLTRAEADALSDYVRNILQIAIAPNGFAASSTNIRETNGCIAHAPFEFASGLLLTLPLSAVDSCFGMGNNEGNELIETAYDRLLRYGLVTRRYKDIIYVKSVREEKLAPKRKKAGRTKKLPSETEKA